MKFLQNKKNIKNPHSILRKHYEYTLISKKPYCLFLHAYVWHVGAKHRYSKLGILLAKSFKSFSKYSKNVQNLLNSKLAYSKRICQFE